MPNNGIVLSYYDSVLRKADIDILKGTNWLTDSIIGFYLQYMENEVYKHHSETDKLLLFVAPEVTQCIKSNSVEDVPIFLEPLNAKEYSLIFFPLNNSENLHSSGGSHWSLLVFHSPENIFYHFDSSHSINEHQAYKLASTLMPYFDKTKSESVIVKQAPTLQQNNSYDCGIHLVCNVDNIARHWLNYRTLNDITPVNKTYVKSGRARILTLISNIQKGNDVK